MEPVPSFPRALVGLLGQAVQYRGLCLSADESVVGNRNDYHDRFHPSDHTEADCGHDPSAGGMADTGCFLSGLWRRSDCYGLDHGWT